MVELEWVEWVVVVVLPQSSSGHLCLMFSLMPGPGQRASFPACHRLPDAVRGNDLFLCQLEMKEIG